MVSEVLIYFVADGNFVPLSVNPEMLPIEREGSNETTDIVGIGEVNLLRLPKLRTCTLESYSLLWERWAALGERKLITG